VISNESLYGKVRGLFARVLVKGWITQAFSKIRKKRRQNDLGKVVSFAAQEVKDYCEPRCSERKAVDEDKDLIGIESKDAL